MDGRSPSPPRRRGDGLTAARSLTFDVVPPPPAQQAPATTPSFSQAARAALANLAAHGQPGLAVTLAAVFVCAVLGGLASGGWGALAGAILGGGLAATTSGRIFPALQPARPAVLRPSPDSPGGRRAAHAEAGCMVSAGASKAVKASGGGGGGATVQTKMDRFIFTSWTAPRSPEIQPA